MLNEYAIEPRIMGSDFHLFSLLHGYFGIERGRVIAQFPKQWSRLVFEAAKTAEMREVDYLRLVERLKSIKSETLCRSGRSYDPELGGWLANAINAHATKPFHAIIAPDNAVSHPSIIDMSEFDPASDLMVAEASQEVKRTATDLTECLATLLRMANDVTLVDPYFEIFSPRYIEPLRHFLGTLSNVASPAKKIKIHRRYDGQANDLNVIRANAVNELQGVIPQGYSVEVFEWEQLPGGHDIHDRYLLCDCGGVSIGAGFSEEGDHELALVSLLSNTVVQNLRNRYREGSGAYRLAKPVLLIDENCNVVERTN
ncbi:hypothetical protein NBRC116601_17290 [Cognatishimia sp. WU-CL00825]|uniref:hypothetical protein n=1 Tax=Cognatishimia sp. WU-CL00825 TaxID=3127658 RepID=UPI00310B3827